MMMHSARRPLGLLGDDDDDDDHLFGTPRPEDEPHVALPPAVLAVQAAQQRERRLQKLGAPSAPPQSPPPQSPLPSTTLLAPPLSDSPGRREALAVAGAKGDAQAAAALAAKQRRKLKKKLHAKPGHSNPAPEP
eukprot:COSAG01_NODE_26195_length_721_cov_1.045016_1_plen_133_part_10